MKTFIFIFLANLAHADQITTIEAKGGVYSNCRYVKLQPVRFDISQACGESKAASNSLCVGLAACDFVDSTTGDKQQNLYQSVGCEANANGTCPPPAECFRGNPSFVSGFEGTVRVQSQAEALAEIERAKTYGAGTSATHLQKTSQRPGRR